jgi:hypothetical protein
MGLGRDTLVKVITVCQDLAYFLDDVVSVHAFITFFFFKAFDLVYYDRLLTKLAASGVDSRAVIWVREFLVGCTQKVRVGGKLPKEVKVKTGVRTGAFWAHCCCSVR